MNNGYFFNNDYLSRVSFPDAGASSTTQSPSGFGCIGSCDTPIYALQSAPERVLDPSVPKAPAPYSPEKLLPFAIPACIIVYFVLFK